MAKGGHGADVVLQPVKEIVAEGCLKAGLHFNFAFGVGKNEVIDLPAKVGHTLLESNWLI